MNTWFRDRPWIWIVVFFLAFLCAWATLITIAVRNSPAPVEPPSVLTPGHDS